jgi:hypothetical protein
MGDFVLKRSGSFRRLAISSWSVREAFGDGRFYPEAFGKLSAAGDFILERSGDFRRLEISISTNVYPNRIILRNQISTPVC